MSSMPCVPKIRDALRHKSLTLYSDLYVGRLESEPESKVALKVVRIEDTNGAFSRRLVQDMAAWCKLSHPNVLPMLGATVFSPISATPATLPAMVAPWRERGNINDYISSLGAHSRLEEMKVKLLTNVAEGLAYLHANDIVHANLKGTNVLVGDDGVAQVADFGFAVIVSDLAALLPSLTVSFESPGSQGSSIRWMAPELYHGAVRRFTTYSDVWAYGCVCIEVFLGHVPLVALRNELKVMMALAASNTLPYPVDMDVAVPVGALIRDCCQLHPEARLSIDALLNRLRVMRLSEATEEILETN